MKPMLFAALVAVSFSACATTPAKFYTDPSKAKDTPLCRSLMESTDPAFQRDVAAELNRRGVTAEQCQQKVSFENAAIIGIAAVATGVTVAAACQNGCGAPGYTPSHTDVDCYGGRGDGPRWQYGPIYVGSYDPNRLDADGDGTGCEASDVGYGS